jgi:UDP-glucuronate decarboxylase
MATEHGFTGPVNIGNPNEFTIRQLAERVLALTKSKSKLLFRDLPADDSKQRQRTSRWRAAVVFAAQDTLDWLEQLVSIMTLLGWEPTIQLDAGLERTIAYFAGLG